MKYRVVIEFEIAEMESRSELREYIKDAINSWGGQRHPDDWLFYGLDKIKVGKIEDLK